MVENVEIKIHTFGGNKRTKYHDLKLNDRPVLSIYFTKLFVTLINKVFA